MMKIAIIILCLLFPCAAFDLPICQDNQKLKEVQSLLDKYHFKYKYENDTFDCVDMAAANWRIMKSAGYDPLIAICNYSSDGGKHCYVIVPSIDGWIGVDTRVSKLAGKSLETSLGKVITDLDGYLILDSDQALYQYDPRGPPKISGDVIVLNSGLPPIFS